MQGNEYSFEMVIVKLAFHSMNLSILYIMKMSMFAKVAYFRLNRIYVLSALAYMFVFDWEGGG